MGTRRTFMSFNYGANPVRAQSPASGNGNDFPTGRSIAPDFQPGERRWCTMVRLADGAGVEMPHLADRFVAGHMGMPVQSKLGAGWHHRDRFVGEEKSVASAGQSQALRTQPARIAIAAHGMHRRSEPAQLLEDVRAANVTEVPNLVRSGEMGPHGGGKMVVGVGNDRDAHLFILGPKRSARKPAVDPLN